MRTTHAGLSTIDTLSFASIPDPRHPYRTQLRQISLLPSKDRGAHTDTHTVEHTPRQIPHACTGGTYTYHCMRMDRRKCMAFKGERETKLTPLAAISRRRKSRRASPRGRSAPSPFPLEIHHDVVEKNPRDLARPARPLHRDIQ